MRYESKKVNWKKMLVFLILVFSLSVSIFIIRKYKIGSSGSYDQISRNGRDRSSQVGLEFNDAVQKEFPGFNPIIDSVEKQGMFDVVRVSFDGGMTSPTPADSAILFFKDGQIQMIPSEYVEKMAESYKSSPGDKVKDVKYYDHFDKLGESSVYDNVYVITIDPEKIPEDMSSAMNVNDEFLLVFVDKYGGELFSTYGPEIMD